MKTKILFFIMLLFSFITLNAQTDTTEIELIDMSLEELLNVDVDIATKSASTLDETPGIVTVIDRKTIELTGAKTLVDIIRMVPGFDFSRASLGWGEPLDEFYARGVVNIFSQTILFLINGRNKLNDLVYASPWMSSRLNVDMIERVEIIRGPGSALYGGNAFSAVINIVTRDTGTEPETIFELSGGQYNTGSLYALTKQKIGKSDWTFGFQGKYFFDGGTTYKSITDTISDFIIMPIGSTVDYKDYVTDGINPSFDVSINVTAPEDKFRFQVWHTSHNPHPALSGFTPQVNANTYNYKVTQSFINLEYEPIKNLTIAAHHSKMTWDARLNYSTPTFNIDEISGTSQLSTHNQIDANYLLVLKGHNIVIGASYSLEAQLDPEQRMYNQAFTSNAPMDIYYTPDERNQMSAFIQDNWIINDKLAVTAGLRYDYYEELKEKSIINPRVAVVWNAFGSSRFKFLFGQAFRPPSTFETSGGLGAYGENLNLKPEKINTGELAYITYFDFARIQISGYYSQVIDAINPVDASGVTILDNVGESTIIGGELELQGKYWWINYSYADSKITDGAGHERTTHFLSPHMVNAGFHYTFFDVLTVRNQIFFRSARPNFVENEADYDYHLVDDFSIGIDGKYVNYVIGAKNIFDTKWQLPLQTTGTQVTTYPYRGREIFVKIIVKIKNNKSKKYLIVE